MKLINVLLFYIMICAIGQTQSFYKIYDFKPKVDHAAYQIKKIKDDSYVVSYFSVCGNPETSCCGLFTIDNKGDILQKNQISNFSNSTRALLVDTAMNRILYCGESDFGSYSEELIVNEIDINDLESIKKFNFKDNKFKYFSVSQKEIQLYNDKYVVVGTGNVEYPEVADTSNSFIYFFNKNLEIDTALYFRFGNSINNQLWEMYEDAQGYLTLHFYHNLQNGFVRILKLDKHYNVVFDWETSDYYNKNRPRGCPLKDGRILLAISNYPNSLVPEIRAINSDKSISWIYVWPYENKNSRIITSLVQSESGHIIGTGSYRDSLYHDYLPFIFALTSSGEILWEKAFYNIKDKITNNVGQFLDIIETDNRDLIAVGFINQRVSFGQNSYDDQDIFIVRVDSEGCLYESCDTVTGVENIVVGSVDIITKDNKEEITVYPNPILGNEINIELNNIELTSNFNAKLYDIYGKQINYTKLLDGHNILDLSNVNNGIFILKIEEGNKLVKIQKLILNK